jgi:AcrR family transcriptional regulator
MLRIRRPRVVLAPDARRQQLITAAATVIARRGYRAAGVSDIVTAAGVARGTFYLYFESKAQIFLAIADDFYDRLELAIERGVAPSADGSGQSSLRETLYRWLEFFHQHREAAIVVLKEAPAIDVRFDRGIAELRQTVHTQFASRFRQFQRLALVRPSLSPEIVAHLQVGMFEELVKAFVLNDDHPDIDRLADQMADFEWNGVRAR